MKRPHAASIPALPLFPFQAVLCCTMGALILLLIVINRQARVSATELSLVATADARADAQRQRAEFDGKLDALRAARQQAAARLAERQLRLAAATDRLEQLRGQRAAVEQAAAEALKNGTQPPGSRAELAELQAAIAKAETDAAAARRDAAQRPRSYAVVPYDGPNQTRRRPLYIECRGDAIVLQPEGIKILDTDFRGPDSPTSPLAVVIKAARDRLADANRASGGKIGEPYPLLIVRPDGIIAFDLARQALASWTNDYGYEFVDQQMPLKYPPADPQISAVASQALTAARARLDSLAGSPLDTDIKPRATYNASYGRVVRDDGGDELGDGPAAGGLGGRAAASGGGRPGRSGSLAGNSIAGGTGGGTNGTGNGGFGPGGENVAGTLRVPSAGSAASAPGLGWSGAGQGARESSGGSFEAGMIGGAADPFGVGGGSRANSQASRGVPNGPTGLASAGNLQAGAGNGSAGGSGLPGRSGSPNGNGPSNGSGISGNGMPGGMPGGTGLASGQNGPGGSSTAGAMGLPGAAASSADASTGGSGSAGFSGQSNPSGMPTGGRSSDPLASAGDNLPPAFSETTTNAPSLSTPPPSMPPPVNTGIRSTPLDATNALARPARRRSDDDSAADLSSSPPNNSEPLDDPSPSDKQKPHKLADIRGVNWGLLGNTRNQDAVTRSIRVECSGDRLTILPGIGLSEAKVIPFTGRTENSVNALVAAVRAIVKNWGYAGRNMYWRPQLVLQIGPSGEGRFGELQALLENSGLDVKKK